MFCLEHLEIKVCNVGPGENAGDNLLWKTTLLP